jgi:hypothetical protein
MQSRISRALSGIVNTTSFTTSLHSSSGHPSRSASSISKSLLADGLMLVNGGLDKLIGDNGSWVKDLPAQTYSKREHMERVRKFQDGTTDTRNFDDMVSEAKRSQDAKFLRETRCLILPGSRGLALWRSNMVFVVLWAVIMAPFELAFSWLELGTFPKSMGYIVDLFCIMDMCMNFCVATIHKGRIISDRKHITLNYLRTWFTIDLITNIPWDLLLNSAGKSRKVVKILKLPKAFRLIRLLRVAKEEAHTLGTFYTIFGMLLITHSSRACGFFSLLTVAMKARPWLSVRKSRWFMPRACRSAWQHWEAPMHG